VNYLHIDTRGNKSLQLYASDERFLTDDGVLEVDAERWRVAQEYETYSMLHRNAKRADDRNGEHAERFSEYRSIAGLSFVHYIELGCGPFTNSRLILPKIRTMTVTLLDPLIKQYMTHKHCSYTKGTLCGHPVCLVPRGIEEISLAEYTNCFDIVVLVNVIEHCRSAQKVLDVILSLLRPNGMLIFSEACISKAKIRGVVETMYDAGHPIRMTVEYVNRFLQNFAPIYRKDFDGLYRQSWRHDVYFIGRKHG